MFFLSSYNRSPIIWFSKVFSVTLRSNTTDLQYLVLVSGSTKPTTSLLGYLFLRDIQSRILICYQRLKRAFRLCLMILVTYAEAANNALVLVVAYLQQLE